MIGSPSRTLEVSASEYVKGIAIERTRSPQRIAADIDQLAKG